MRKKLVRILFFLIMIILLGTGIAAGILLNEGHKRYEEAIQENAIETLVSEIQNSENFVPYEELDKNFVEAIVAIEDHRFFQRKGVDIIAIGRSFLSNLVTGEIKEGGSTITQQVGKNLYFSHKASYTRKVAEIFLVEDLEEMYTKEEILAIYVNMIYYGDGYTGVQAASQGYFHKDASDLTLYEATLLAGFPQSPSRYQLSNGYELINKRQKNIVRVLLKMKLITQSEADEILAQQPE